MKSVVQSGLGDNARLVMVAAPAASSRASSPPCELIARLEFVRARAAGDPRHRGGVRVLIAGPDRALPRPPAVRARRPGRHAGEGSTPLVPRRALSERVGAEVYLKLEGANPTGSFKDRGMTCAVSAAVREGAEAVICASTGNTAASAAAYAARAGLRGAVIVPEGKIATGKLAQALMHGARVIALRGNFDQALRARARARRSAIRSRSSTRSTRSASRARRRRPSRSSRSSASSTRSASRSATPGNITAYWKGFQEAGAAPRMLGFQAEGAAPLVRGRAGRAPRDGRQRDPHRQPGPLGGGDGGDARVAAARSRAVSDDEILDAYRLLAAARGRLLRAGLGGVGGRAAALRRRRRASASSAC